MTSTLIDSAALSTKIETYGNVKFRINVEPRLTTDGLQRFIVRPGFQLIIPRSLYNHRTSTVTTTEEFKFDLCRIGKRPHQKYTAAELIEDFPCVEAV